VLNARVQKNMKSNVSVKNSKIDVGLSKIFVNKKILEKKLNQ